MAHPYRMIPTDHTGQLPQGRAPQSYPLECVDGVYFGLHALDEDDRMADHAQQTCPDKKIGRRDKYNGLSALRRNVSSRACYRDVPIGV